MRDARWPAVELDHFVFFPVFEIRESLHNNVDGTPAIPAVNVLKPARGLRANKVGKALFVIQRMFCGVRQDPLLLPRVRRLKGLRARLGSR